MLCVDLGHAFVSQAERMRRENHYDDKFQSGMEAVKIRCHQFLNALSTPVSNAVVERVFSQVTAIKTKYRNRLSLKMLDAILRIRLNLHLRGTCCNSFTVTASMLERLNNSMYKCEGGGNFVDLAVLLDDEM